MSKPISRLSAETRESGGTKKLIKYYYDDTGVVGFNLDGADYYFVKSLQGDVEKIYSASGELKAECIFWNTDDEEENGFYSWRFL